MSHPSYAEESGPPPGAFKEALEALLDLLTASDSGRDLDHPEMVSARQQARTLLKRYRQYLPQG